jgi:hypothetical protein
MKIDFLYIGESTRSQQERGKIKGKQKPEEDWNQMFACGVAYV